MTSASKPRRLGVLLLVLIVALQPAVGGAMASSSGAEMTPDDDCDYGILNPEAFHDLFGLKTTECAAQQLSNATHSDLYASTLAQHDMGVGARFAAKNHLEDTKTIARTIAKREIVHALRNGSNLSVARQNINSSINDYYGTLQHNLISSASSSLTQSWYLFKAREQSISNTSVMGVWNVNAGYHNMGYAPYDTKEVNSTPAEYWYNGTSTQDMYFHLRNETSTLIDGSNVSHAVMVIDFQSNGETYYADPTNTTTSAAGTAVKFWEFGTAHPENDWNEQAEHQYVGGLYIERYEEIAQQAESVKVEAAAYAERVYNTYNASDFDGLELLDPITLAKQFNTDYNSTGYYGWVAAEMGLAGLNGTINSSFAINYTPRLNHSTETAYFSGLNGTNTSDYREYAYVAGESYNLSGTLFTSWDPNPNATYAFERGVTYNTSNTNKPVYFIAQNDSQTARIVELQGEFTIDELTNVKTGESLNNTSLEDNNYQTWNESSTIQEIKALLEYRNESVSINEAGGGGSGGFDLGGLGIGALAFGGLAALIILGSGAGGAAGGRFGS